jgi:hypothetical protein
MGRDAQENRSAPSALELLGEALAWELMGLNALSQERFFAGASGGAAQYEMR